MLSRLFFVVTPAPAGFDPLTYRGQGPAERALLDMQVFFKTCLAAAVVVGGLAALSALLIGVLGVIVGGPLAFCLVWGAFICLAWYYGVKTQYYDQELTARLRFIKQQVETVEKANGNGGQCEVQEAIDAFLEALDRHGGPQQFIDPQELVRQDADTYIGDNIVALRDYGAKLHAATTAVEVLHLSQQLPAVIDKLPRAAAADGQPPTFGAAVAKHRMFFWPRFLAAMYPLMIAAGLVLIWAGILFFAARS